MIDFEGISWDLIFGTSIELINWYSYWTYYIFELSRPKITDSIDRFNQYLNDEEERYSEDAAIQHNMYDYDHLNDQAP